MTHGSQLPILPHLSMDAASVQFTIYQGSARLARKVIFRTVVGGAIGSSADNSRVVVRALENITLDIKSGDRVALLGHNGAGKTTMLRALAGIYEPTAGRVTSVGRRVPLFDIGFGYDDEASGYENIVLRGLLMGLSKADITKKIDEIAAFSGLGDYLNLPVRTYSSGMALRLLFSIATSVDADILLMDEWIATGDEKFREQADRRLRELVDRSHILVLASHNMELLKSICSRAIILNGGRIAFDGPVGEAIERYAHR